MSRICWRLVDIVSLALEPAERDAVRGDFAESGENGVQALRGVLGLAARRQMELWKDWRPWLALVGLALPTAWLLALSSLWVLGGLDLYVWIIRNYRDIDPAILQSTGLTLRHGIPVLVSRLLLLAAWSSSVGFTLGVLSRRAIWSNGALFWFVLILSGHLPFWSHSRASFWPLMLEIILILAPSWWGMRQASRQAPRLAVEAALWAAAILTALAAQNWFWPLSHPSWQMRLLLLSKYWPLAYLVAAKIGWIHFKEKHA